MPKLKGKAKARFLTRMAKGRKAAIKARGGKKGASGAQAHKYVATAYRNGRKIKVDELEGRIIELERIIEHFSELDPSERAKIDVTRTGGLIEEHTRLKKKLDAGDW